MGNYPYFVRSIKKEINFYHMCNRCQWCGDDPLYVSYHDKEWGVPNHDDRQLFEFLVLESFQAGLSWITVLRKREHFRKAFDFFSIQTVADYTDMDLRRLMANEQLIRNRQKILAAINNAQCVLNLQQNYGSFDKFLWDYVDGQPIQNHFSTLDEVPAQTELSQKLSKDLKNHGIKFMGPTTAYAYMQAIGMVNDHVTDCFRYRDLRD